MFLRLQCNRSVISGLVTCASFLHAPRDVPTVIGRGVPNMHGWCAEPSVCNPPKGSQAPHTRGSEWEQGRTPAGHGGETLPRSLHSEGMGPGTPPCQGRGGQCLGAAKGHREHPAASPCCSHLSLSTLCPQSTTNTFHMEAEAVTSPVGAGAPENSCQCVGPGTSLTLFAGRASAAHRGCRC